MSMTRDTHARLEDTQAQLSRLRSQVEGLVREVGPMFSDAASRAEAAVTEATGVTRAQAKAALGGITLLQVSIVVAAAAAGWVIGRTTR